LKRQDQVEIVLRLDQSIYLPSAWVWSTVRSSAPCSPLMFERHCSIRRKISPR